MVIMWNSCRWRVMERDKCCQLCGAQAASDVDHIIPVSLGGTGDLDNLRLLCHGCHAVETARLRRYKTAYVARRTVDEEPCATSAACELLLMMEPQPRG